MIFKPTHRATLHSEVLTRLTQAIQSGDWPVGSKLPGEIALSKMFKVSRACIREVLKALAYSGVVEARPGLGTFLLRMPDQDSASSAFEDLLKNTSYSHLLEVRRLMEGQSAYWATERASTEEVEKLERILSNNARLPLSEVHKMFHTKVAEYSKNPIFIYMVSQLEQQYAAQRALNFAILPDEDRLEHWKVLHAIKSRDPRAAQQAMEDHVDYLWKKRSLLESATSK